MMPLRSQLLVLNILFFLNLNHLLALWCWSTVVTVSISVRNEYGRCESKIRLLNALVLLLNCHSPVFATCLNLCWTLEWRTLVEGLFFHIREKFNTIFFVAYLPMTYLS